MKIKRPTLIIDEQKVRRNIKRVVDKSSNLGLAFRPHFKTHQSHEVGRWFRELGVTRIAVSSVTMAEYFAKDGWQDITIAFPYNQLEWAEIDQLAADIKINVVIESKASLDHIESHFKNQISYLIKTDVGYGRTGLADPAEILSLSRHSSKKVKFGGLLAHAGHTYNATVVDQIISTHEVSIKKLNGVLQVFEEKPFVTYGDTPSCSTAQSFDGVDELRCGNLVYYDLTQAQIGSCAEEDIAVVLACPVVAHHPERSEVVIYGGAVHLSKDKLPGENGHFGKVVQLSESGWKEIPGVVVSKISQEHGIIKLQNQNQFELIPVGAVIGVLPVHSCLVADMMTAQSTLQGDTITKMEKI